MFMELPVSGIHRLFTAASSQSSHSSKPPLESVTEESHTFDLLYPDFNTLQQAQDQVYSFRHGNPTSIVSAANSFDDRGALDVHSPRDVRIIVAQDGNAAQQAKVLFDTHPPPPLPSGRLGSPISSRGGIDGGNQQTGGLPQRTNTTPQSPPKSKHTRFFSFSQATQTHPPQQPSPLSPTAKSHGAFASPRARRASARPATSEGETNQITAAREGKEELDGLLDSIFGSTGTPLLSGTKTHVRTPTTREAGLVSHNDAKPKSPELDVPRRKRTPLTRSTTADDIHFRPSSAPSQSAHIPRPRSQNSSVLITRLFAADPSELLSRRLNTDQGQPPEVLSKDRHDRLHSKDSGGISEIVIAKQIKCPMYAVSIMLQLPSTSCQGWSSATKMASPILPESPRTSSFSVGGQSNEDRVSGWSLCSADRDVEHITGHWNLITKFLDHLEAMTRKEISGLLATVAGNLLHPSLHLSPLEVGKDMPGSTGSPTKKARQPSQRIIQLPANALQHCEAIRHEISKAGQRVAVALRTRRVVTSQGRWGIWREEARWVGRWAGSREQNFFFFNLLTAFLGSHTEWLELLLSTRTRRFRSKAQRRDAGSTTHRQTVIVSADKMAARRLIFLLSAFLPSTAPPLQDAMIVPPTCPWVGTSYSQSPPSGIPLLREQSLRRKINRRQRGNLANQGSTGTHGRSLSFAGSEHGTSSIMDHAFESSKGQHIRRTSDTKSIRSPALALAANGESTRKSSTTTTSTVVPDAAVPVAHFSNVIRDPSMGTSPAPRPGSSGSLASLSLKHTLDRSESNEHSNASTGSQSLSRWGSMMSGFWSSRRGSSTDDSEYVGPSPEGLGISGAPKLSAMTSSPRNLLKMVDEAETVSHIPQEQIRSQCLPEISDSAIVEDVDSEQSMKGPAALHLGEAESTPKQVESGPFPIKLSVDDDDGIIDVELPPLDSCASSLGSSCGSTGHIHTAASSFNERSSNFTRSPSKERSQTWSDTPIDVAGWLKEYNQDFTLQAVRPYPKLDDAIKEAMTSTSAALLSTKRPLNTDTATTDWSDVMTTLIGNTTSFSVTRIRLQHRLNSANPPHPNPKPVNQDIEQRIIEEPIMDMDPTLIDAVERVLAKSGHSSRVQSRTPSRAPSPSRTTTHYRSPEKTHTRSQSNLHSMATPQLEVPKSECKKLVLGALEEVVRSVQAEQDEGKNDGARRISGEPVRSGEENLPPDSTLREGVRRWLKGVGFSAGRA
ncbi:MAG: hypothetical protein LQ337_007987 [Flavoplaca oasis]|nr:MAG: hypothetical protein LQ337_007987 [Flavoplaca oasis]